MECLSGRVSLQILILPLTLILGACSQNMPSTQPTAAAFIAGAGPGPAKPTPLKSSPASLPGPIRVALLQDVSGSIGLTATPRTAWSDLETIIPALAHRGGELAVGLIGEREEPLVRLRLERFLATEPAVPTEVSNNPFIQAEQLHAYQRDLVAYQSAIEQWRSSNSKRVDIFRRDTARILGRPAIAPSTDIWSAVALASVFLHEPESASATAPHLWIIAVSDGRDTVHHPPIAIPGDTRVIVVTGTRDVGVLERFKPLRFTSVPAALAWVAREESQ